MRLETLLLDRSESILTLFETNVQAIRGHIAANSRRDSMHSQSAAFLHESIKRTLTLRESIVQAIREQYIGNSRSGAENSRRDSAHSQSAAFQFCLP